MWSAPANGLHRGVGRRFSAEPRGAAQKLYTGVHPNHTNPSARVITSAGVFHLRQVLALPILSSSLPHRPKTNVWRHFFAQRGGVEMVTVIIFTNYYWAPFQKLFEAFHHMYG